jgi:hypothetical protein
MSVLRFYRRQAETCLRLAQACRNSRLADRYRLMAQAFLDRADNARDEPDLPANLLGDAPREGGRRA